MICGETDDMYFDQVIELVDRQLYKAKKSGRNMSGLDKALTVDKAKLKYYRCLKRNLRF
jgi:hypothetical protein